MFILLLGCSNSKLSPTKYTPPNLEIDATLSEFECEIDY